MGSGFPDEASGAPTSGIRTHSVRSQAIEAEEAAIDGQDFEAGQPGCRREGTHRLRADHRANRRRWLLGHRHREAMHDAPTVHEPFDVVSRRVEVFADFLIGDDHAGPWGKGIPHRSQGLVWARHVMERFQYQHQIERAFLR